MSESDDNFKLDLAAAQETFDRLNTELFDGQLQRIPIRLSNAVKKGGSYLAKAVYKQQNVRIRRLLRDYRIENLHDQAITLSRKVILTQNTLDIVVAHEMIHQWQSAVLGISEDNAGHGETFLSKMGEINAVKGAGFVSVTSDVVPGGTGGKAGQVYYVAIFEKGARKFGGFSRQPFTEKILDILRQSSERRGIPYRTVVTTSHDAQNLKDMSRMKLGLRGSSWTIIPVDIYDAIMSGEVTTAALRRAAIRVADVQHHDTSPDVAAALRRATAAVALAGMGETIRYQGELWHGTSLGAAASIARSGFSAQPHDELSCDAISLSKNMHAAEIFAGRDGVVFEFEADFDRLFVLPEFVYDAMLCYRGSGACDEEADERLMQHADDLKRLGVMPDGWPGDEPPEWSEWREGEMNESDWLDKALTGYEGVIVPGFESTVANAEAEIAVFDETARRLKNYVVAMRVAGKWYSKGDPKGSSLEDGWSVLKAEDPGEHELHVAIRDAAADVLASSGTIIAYHATLSGSAIIKGGFKKSDEVERVGLGGSSLGGSVSFTTDWGVAVGIHKSFAMMHSLVNADDPLAAMKEHFESLGQLTKPVLQFWESADGRDLKELLDGWKPKPYGSRMQTYDRLVQQGFKPVHAAGDEGGEGDTLYYQWLEPVTGEDAERMVYTYVKVYFYANDDYNPVFMGGDASHFKGIPLDDIGVFTVELHIDPSKKHGTHGDLDRAPGYAILPAESEYRVSDMSMIGKILDYDTHPGDAPKVRAEEVSFHSDTETEEAVNKLLSLLQRHRGIIERGDKLDVRQAMALLRNADDMWGVIGIAGKILAATGLKHTRRAIEEVINLQKKSQPSDKGSKAIAAMPPSVRSEVEQASHSESFVDISERWYDRDEPSYIAWATRLGELGMSESAAESEIDDWISSKQWGYEKRIAEEVRYVKMDVPGFKEEDIGEFLELATGLEDATQHSRAAATLRVAIRTVFEAGDTSKARHFILRRGKLWLWGGLDLGGSDEARLVESIQEEFGTDRPPFDQKFPIDNQYRVRDMFESSRLFGPPSDEDMTRFREFASDTLFGMVLPDGTLRVRTVTGLPVHADHPEMEKLLKHLGAETERPQLKGVWYHGFIATPERMAGVSRFGLRPGEATEESNWGRNEEYDRSLVYLTTDTMNAKGHATGNEGEYPYAVVVAIREENLDPTRMEADFDAQRAGFKPNRAGLSGYRGRIPVSIFSEVKIYRNGYNQETTPLLLTLEPDEFSSLAQEYAEWAEHTKEDREALDNEQRHGPSFTDHGRMRELHDKIGKDPIRLAVDAAKGEVVDIAASLRAANAKVATPDAFELKSGACATSIAQAMKPDRPSRTATREPAFLKKLRDVGTIPPPDVASAALSSVMNGTLIHSVAGSTGTPGEDLSEKMRSVLDNGVDPAYWAKPWKGSPGAGHPQAVYLSLAWEAALDNPPPNYVFVEPKLSNPLVLRAGRDENYTWGPDLNEATGKSGAGLSSFLRARGYDSIITVHKYGIGEVAYFGKEPLPAFLPEADHAAHMLGAAAEIIKRIAAVEDIFRGVKTVIEKHKGRGLFARFSDVPKIGIRPSTEHHDPYGVYFYPVDWLAENVGFGTTYVNLPYITVARIRRSGWLNLGTIRPAKARQLAEKGGVLDEYEAQSGGRAGKRLWDAVEAQVKPFESESNKLEWNRIFGRMGVKAVYDPGTGSVNSAEPAQIVVLDLSLIEVVDVVENREDRKSVFHTVLKAVADKVLDEWRVAGSHAEGGIWAAGSIGGAPVEMSVMPAKVGFEMEVTLSYHDPSGKKRRIVSRGRMPNEWEDAPADYLSEGHASSISRKLEEAELGPGGAADAEDMLDAALRALTKLRLPDLTVKEKGEGTEFWKNTGDGKVQGSLKVLPDGRMELEIYAEDWLLFGGESSSVIELGPMRVSWEGDPSSATADMAAELSRAVRELRVTDDEGKPLKSVDMESAAEIVRMRTLSWTFPDDILEAAGLPRKKRKTAAVLWNARLRLAGQQYWHGSSGENIRKIAAAGFVDPGVPEGHPGRGYQKPMPGRSYATTDLSYALIYAIEAAMVGRELPKEVRFDGDGGIVSLEGEGDALPDEDWVGELISDCESSRRRQRGDPNARSGEVLEWKEKLYADLRRSLPSRVVSMIDRKPTWKLDEMATQSMIGKNVNRWLLKQPPTHFLRKALVARSPHHSYPGRMMVTGAWVFNKREVNPKLKKDGSNFLALATEIPVGNPSVTASECPHGDYQSYACSPGGVRMPSRITPDIHDAVQDLFTGAYTCVQCRADEAKVASEPLKAWHGTIDRRLDLIRESGGLRNPYLAAPPEAAALARAAAAVGQDWYSRRLWRPGEKTPGAGACWRAEATLPDGRTWRDSGSGSCPDAIRVPPGAADILVVTDVPRPTGPRIVGGARTAAIEAWHGTDSDFTAFDMAFTRGQLGFHFGTEEQAGDIFGGEIPPQRIIHAELDIENPLRMPDLGGWQGHAAKAEFERALGVKIPGSGSDASIVRAVTDAGYDGIVYANRFEGEDEVDSYIVFNASQIRIIGDRTNQAAGGGDRGAAALSRAALAIAEAPGDGLGGMSARDWAESIRRRVSGIAEQFGAAVVATAAESGSWYLRIRFDSDPDDRDFTVRVSTHRSRKSGGRIKVHPWDAEFRLRELEIRRRSGFPREAAGKELWEMDSAGPEYAAMSIEELDRAAFGFSREDIETLHPSQLHIKWQDDLENVIHEQHQSGLSGNEWAKRIDLSEPIEVVFENGKFYVDDGYHRFHAAKILNKELRVTVEINDKPHRAIVEKALLEGKPVPPGVLSQYPDLSAALSRAARALGEHLGETVTAYRALAAEHAEKIMREGFTGGHHRHGVYYTANRERAAFYARFMSSVRLQGVIFEMEVDTSRSTADVNDATDEQSEELFEEVKSAAGDMVQAVHSNTVELTGRGVRLWDSDIARLLESWLGGLTVSEGFYESPEQHSVWQLLADETKGTDDEMTIADAREALPPGRYGEMTILDSRGVAGIDVGEISGQAQAMSDQTVPVERLTAVWIPSALLEAAGETAPTGAETMADHVDVIPAKFTAEFDDVNIISEAERQRDEAREKYESDPPEGMAADDEEEWYSWQEEVADEMDSILDRWKSERDSTMPGHIYSKLINGEMVTPADLSREERLVRFPLPEWRLRAVKVVRKAIAASEPGQARRPADAWTGIERAARRAADAISQMA